MRVLFLQVARHYAPEYGNHHRHARNAGAGVHSFFIRQAETDYAPGRRSSERKASGYHYYFEFGRNLALRPRPSRTRRALMMSLAIPVNLPAVVRTARRLEPDVIYTSQQREDIQLGFLLSRLLKVPHIIALHYPVGPWLGRIPLGLIRRSRTVVAVSEFVRQTAIEQGVVPACIQVVNNSVDIGPFLKDHDRVSKRRELGIPDDSPVIISIGRLDPGKGHHDLIRAVALLRSAVPDVRLVICGRSFSRSRYHILLKEETERLGLTANVIFAGFRRDIPELLAASDVFCLPTINEAFPNVFLEAMAAARPAVGYDVGGVPEIVVHGETGYLAEQHDINSLSNYLRQLLVEEGLAQRMGEAGRERVQSCFIPAVRAPHWARTVRELLAG